METKTCKLCGQEYPATIEYWHKAKHGKYGLHPQCKKCRHLQRIGQYLNYDVPIPDGHRVCTKCNKFYPATLDYFHSHKKGKNGLGSWCIECHNQRNKRNSRRLRLDPEYRQRDIEYKREYRASKRGGKIHRDYVRAYHRQKRAEKDFKFMAYTKAKNSRRKARKRNASGTHTAADILRIYNEQEGLCAYCGIRLFDEYHVDHIVPLSRGGSNAPDNLACACPDCNLSKSDKLVSEWIEVRGW